MSCYYKIGYYKIVYVFFVSKGKGLPITQLCNITLSIQLLENCMFIRPVNSLKVNLSTLVCFFFSKFNITTKCTSKEFCNMYI